MPTALIARRTLLATALIAPVWGAELTFLLDNGIWNDATNWSGGALPTASDHAIIPANRTVRIPSSMTLDANMITMESGAKLEIAHNITVTIPKMLTEAGYEMYLESAANGSDHLASTVLITGSLTVPANGQIHINHGLHLSVSGTITSANKALLQFDDNAYNAFTLGSSGTWEWAVTNAGQAAVLGAKSVTLAGTLAPSITTEDTTLIPDTGSEVTLIQGASTTLVDAGLTERDRPAALGARVVSGGQLQYPVQSTSLILQTLNITTPTALTYGDSFALTRPEGFSSNNTEAVVTWEDASTPAPLLTLTSAMATATGVGTASLQARTSQANGYTAASDVQTITIARKAVTITIDGSSRVVGAANPDPIVSVSGLVLSDTVAALGTPTITWTDGAAPTATSPAGSYGFTMSYTPVHYQDVSGTGTLTITTATHHTGPATNKGGGGCGVGGGLALMALVLLGLRRRV